MNVLILGSAPNVTACRDWDLSGVSEVVAINNAWQVRPDWTVSIYPDDFPVARRPQAMRPPQRQIGSEAFVPAMNRFGGVVYTGGTMAFTASYWALAAMQPSRILYFGCDMVYAPKGRTHFYGEGTADPLRADPTIQSLEAKARRFQAIAARQGCAVYNLSQAPSRLPYPRSGLPLDVPGAYPMPDAQRMDAALALEAELACYVPSGRYWDESVTLDPVALAQIDRAWMTVFP